MSDNYPSVTFTKKVVQKVGDLGNVLARFLETQEAEIQKRLEEEFPGVSGNMLAQVLNAFSSLEGTKIPHAINDLKISDVGEKELKFCLTALEDSRILRHEDDIYEFAHDALALQIAERRSSEDKSVLELEELIRSRLKASIKTYLTEEELNSLRGYEKKFHLSNKERSYVKESIAFWREKKQRRKKSIIATITVLSALVAISIILGILAGKWFKKKNEVLELVNVSALNAKSIVALEVDKSPTEAFGFATQAWELKSDEQSKKRVLDAWYNKDNSPLYQSFIGHTLAVNFADLSPDGTYLVTASSDSTARVWNKRGKDTLIYKEHSGTIYSAVFSDSGQEVLTASADGTARLWDLEGKTIAVFKDHASDVISAIFSPDETKVLTFSEDYTARIWKRDGKTHKIIFHDSLVYSAVFSPDGQSILTSTFGKAKLSDLDGNLIREFPHSGLVIDAVFSPDGNWILTCFDSSATLWHVSGDFIRRLNHEGEVIKGIFSPDGRYMATASADHTAKLWPVDGSTEEIFLKHNSYVVDLDFSPDSRKLLTGSYDKTAVVWNLQGDKLTSLLGHFDHLTLSRFSPDGKKVITASKDKKARIWHLEAKAKLTLNADAGEVRYATFHPDHKYIATAYREKTVVIWNPDGTIHRSIKDLPAGIRTVQFSNDGNSLLTAGDDGFLRLFDLEGNETKSIKAHNAEIRSAFFSSDGQFIITASLDSMAKLFRPDGTEVLTLRQNSWIRTARFSPQSDRIVTASGNSQAVVWDINGDSIDFLRNRGYWVLSASFSSDGKALLVASEQADRNVRIWEIGSTQLAIADGHTERTYSVMPSPDGRFIISSSRDKTARVWENEGANIGREYIRLLDHQGPVYYSEFSPDGRQLITASADGTAKIWDLDPDALLKRAIAMEIDIFRYDFSTADERLK